jgi:hypothetical protein
MLVKKSNGDWRMCIDYTDLNKACPKDHFPLPSINSLVNATSGFKYLRRMHSHGTIRLKCTREMKEKQLSPPIRVYIATKLCHLA